MKLRHELKHIINHADYLVLRHRLTRLFQHDNNAGAHGEYCVRSLYFDTRDDHALKQIINGVDRREKFRLRMYNGDASYIRLEKKTKQNGLYAKKRALLTKEQVEWLLQGDTEWMRDSGEPLLLELYSKMHGQQLRPKTVVEYIRESFVYPAGNVRITLDREIKTGLTSTGFLDNKLPLFDAFKSFMVLEIKYDEYIPDLVIRAVQVSDRRRSAFSKYSLCRKYG